jgi:hypothetical protein
MTPSEKVAYLKGLAEGLGIDSDSKEGKLLSAIIDVLDELAADLENLSEDVCDISDDLDELYEEVDDITDYLVDDEDEDDDDDDYDDYFDDEEPVFYEVTCPACENTITIDEDVLLEGAIACPNCGETLEFDFDSIEDIDEDEE